MKYLLGEISENPDDIYIKSGLKEKSDDIKIITDRIFTTKDEVIDYITHVTDPITTLEATIKVEEIIKNNPDKKDELLKTLEESDKPFIKKKIIMIPFEEMFIIEANPDINKTKD